MVGDNTMSNGFGIQKMPAYGSFGEFTIGEGSSAIRAKYILTKIRPGHDGSWECELASQMKPWREIFNVEELDFDELLQRDIDDSRIAHELIPYLLGKSGNIARFFPPILAVIVPRKEDGSGIEQYYPSPQNNEDLIEKYEDLFDFEQITLDDDKAPMAALKYNRQRSAFIIVDGQHRAMAVLALHRQLNKNWGDKAFASYYEHIEVTSEQVKSIELPTCIIYFPDLHKDNLELQEKNIDLKSVCREIFLVVNRSAKRVSESRELLLDDEDIAARLMRKTLSAFKERGNKPDGLARIYSISYGDSDTKLGEREVISGQLTFSSAIALHKAHRAISFGSEEAFTFENPSDISDGRRTQNPNRAPEILIGTDVEECNPLSYKSGNSLPQHQVKKVVEKLGNLADIALVNLFDKFRPFEIHNIELQELKGGLSSVQANSDAIDKKVYALIFEGSGIRNVFDSHFENLKEERKKHLREDQIATDYLQEQIRFCQSVKITLDKKEREFQRIRACKFFGIDHDLFYKNNNQSDQKVLEDKARKLYQTLATQAFQLGYIMAIFTVIEELKLNQSSTSPFPYQDRLKLVEFVTEVYLTALNIYFSPKNETAHRTLSGYIREPRASVFDANSQGLRGLLLMSVNELNERQWRFFRYAILEIVHSPFCWDAAQEKMKQISNNWTLEWYKAAIPRLVEGIISEREKYIEDAVDASVKGREFEYLRIEKEAEARVKEKSPEEIQQIVEDLQKARKAVARENASQHLQESLKKVEEKEKMVNRLMKELA